MKPMNYIAWITIGALILNKLLLLFTFKVLKETKRVFGKTLSERVLTQELATF